MPLPSISPPSRRRRDIQGLRAVAVLLVVAYHAGLPVPGGFTGVDVFFVISGFVITSLLVSELAARDSLSLRRFYARRARRLLPALGVMLSVVAVLGVFAAPFGAQEMAAITTAAASLFAANAYLIHLGTGYFDVQTTLNPLLHTWTLAVEEQFYLVFPGVIAVAWWIGRKRATWISVGAITIASFVLSQQLSPAGGATGRFAFYGSPTRAWEFGLGALFALAPLSARRMPLVLAATLGVAGAVLIDIGATALHGTDGFPGTQALLPVIGTCLLIAGGTAPRAPMSRLLASRPLVAIGDLSYSWYLWHWPLIVFGVALLPRAGWIAPAAAFASIVPAWASYRFLENPIRRRLRFARVPAPALAGVCIALPLIAAVGLTIRHTELSHNARFADLASSQRLHADVVHGCDDPKPLGARTGDACTWKVANATGTIVLLGDSNAGQFTEPVVRAANSLGYDATVATFSSCPFTLVRMRDHGAIGDDTRCLLFVQGSVKALLRLKPSLVIIASRTDSYLRAGSLALGAVGTGDTAAPLVLDEDPKSARFEQGLARILLTLNNAGVPVVLVHPVPRVPFDAARCAVSRVLNGTCTGIRSRQEVDAELHLAISIEDRAAASVSDTWAIGFENELCGARTCRTSRDGRGMYRDEDHLSIVGALTLTDQFAATMSRYADPL